MSNVIDALKRLERVGSDNSKTTEKLLEAAVSISGLIVEYYDADERIYLSKEAGREFPREFEYAVFLSKTASGTTGRKEKQLYVEHAGMLEYVAANRRTAMKFAEDVAAGFIDRLVDDLEERKRAAGAAHLKLVDVVKVLEKE